METRANHVVIGFLTLVVALAAFGFVWWFGARATPAGQKVYNIAFEGSVSGLTTGSTVSFNGIRVGQVSGLKIDPDRPNRIIATIAVDQSTPMRTDTKASLAFQGLTGVATIELSGGSADAKPLPGPPSHPPTILAERSGFQDLMKGASALMGRANDVLTRVDDFVKTNQGPLSQSVGNIQRFTGALAANSDQVSHFLAATGDAATSISGLSHQLQGVVAAVDPKKVSSIVGNADRATSALADAAPKIGQAADNAAALAQNLRGESDQLGGTLRKIDALVSAVDPKKVGETVDNITAFSGTLAANRQKLDTIVQNAEDVSGRTKSLVDAVDPKKVASIVDNATTFSASMARTGPKVEALADNASGLMQDLHTASGQLTTTLGKVDTLLAAVDPKKIGTTVDNVTAFSDTLAGNRQSIDDIVKNAKELSARLNASSTRLDSILQKADNLLGEGGKSGMFDQVTAAAKSIKVLADHLDQRTAKLTNDLSGFTGPGLRQLEALIASAREAVGNIDRVARDLERNPRRFLFGGSQVRDYSSGR
jgi:phospholipid/cholesterol/gamma-HCH transport system substrate-binding protein